MRVVTTLKIKGKEIDFHANQWQNLHSPQTETYGPQRNHPTKNRENVG